MIDSDLMQLRDRGSVLFCAVINSGSSCEGGNEEVAIGPSDPYRATDCLGFSFPDRQMVTSLLERVQVKMHRGKITTVGVLLYYYVCVMQRCTKKPQVEVNLALLVESVTCWGQSDS